MLYEGSREGVLSAYIMQTGKPMGCTIVAMFEVVIVMTETLSLVAAWFCFNLTAGAPTNSRVRKFFSRTR